MNKQQLVSAIAEKAGLTKKQASAAVDAFMATVKEALSKGEEVRLVGFGTFQVRQRKARKGKNPRTGEVINIPAKKVPVFRPSSELKSLVK
ncbi:hypothetical protein DRO33_06220 [Candidatus Bathyarchaeota archaeon]|nr:MAG: hypothetical protein DRO33_06220 [Candidatus Bathyarchaeota archaeon]